MTPAYTAWSPLPCSKLMRDQAHSSVPLARAQGGTSQVAASTSAVPVTDQSLPTRPVTQSYWAASTPCSLEDFAEGRSVVNLLAVTVLGLLYRRAGLRGK